MEPHRRPKAPYARREESLPDSRRAVFPSFHSGKFPALTGPAQTRAKARS